MSRDTPNMSYCQFQNTLRAVQQCYDTLANEGEEPKEAFEKLSKDEQQAHNDLLDLMANMLTDLGYTVEGPDNG